MSALLPYTIEKLTTVGELRKALADLPDHTSIFQDNFNKHSAGVGFRLCNTKQDNEDRRRFLAITRNIPNDYTYVELSEGEKFQQ